MVPEERGPRTCRRASLFCASCMLMALASRKTMLRPLTGTGRTGKRIPPPRNSLSNSISPDEGGEQASHNVAEAFAPRGRASLSRISRSRCCAPRFERRETRDASDKHRADLSAAPLSISIIPLRTADTGAKYRSPMDER